MSDEGKIKRLAPPIEVVKLDDILDALEELIELEKKSIPRGERASYLTWVKDVIFDAKQSYPMPWFTVTIHNYSGASVFFSLNKIEPTPDRVYYDEIRVGETREVRYGNPKIERVNLVCPSGTSALVRLSGVY